MPPPMPDEPNSTYGCAAFSFIPMPALPPAASTVPPVTEIVPSASSG